MHTQEDFIDLANSGNNIFLTGVPGSGKSYIMNKWKEQNKHLKIVTVAPTGIAAVNAGGTTIHSLFNLYGDNYHVFKKPKVNFNEIDVLIIDEVSMVSCEMFDFIKESIERRTNRINPFGGLQIILVGDLKQLPPIFDLRKEETKIRYNKLIEDFGGVEFTLSKGFEAGGFEIINLTESKRSDDDKLNSLLQDIREGNLFAVHSFKNSGYSTQFWNSATHIFSFNNQVDEHNYNQLLKVPGKQKVFKGLIKGEFNTNNVLVPLELKLKVGARIMIVKNLDNGLVNGDLGEVKEINKDNIIIYSDRLEEYFPIGLQSWDNIEFDEHGNETKLGSFIQYPIKLSYGITSHKSQGLTLEKVIIHYNRYMSQESLYVALSRGKTFDNTYVIK